MAHDENYMQLTQAYCGMASRAIHKCKRRDVETNRCQVIQQFEQFPFLPNHTTHQNCHSFPRLIHGNSHSFPSRLCNPACSTKLFLGTTPWFASRSCTLSLAVCITGLSVTLVVGVSFPIFPGRFVFKWWETYGFRVLWGSRSRWARIIWF